MIKEKARKKSIKIKEKDLLVLEKEVEKSRLAIQNMCLSNKRESEFQKQIWDIQKNLQECINKINQQTKRQKILKELINLLNREMTSFQNKQKNVQEIENEEFEKKRKKLRYDIDKISQKKNQQTAKITVLKDKANSCRSERVVFSNLFKKLQNELKVYEETYKQQLMSSEIVKREIAKDSEKKGKRKNKRNNSIHLQENSKEIKGVDNEIFYDFLDQRMIKSKSRRVRSNRTQILNDYKNLQKEKQFYQAQINKLQVFHLGIQTYTSCQSTSQICELSQRLQPENQLIFNEISKINSQLYNIQKQHQQIHKNMKKVGIVQFQRTEQQPTLIKSSKKSNLWFKMDERKLNISEMKKIVSQLGLICEVQLEQGEEIYNNDGALMEVDAIISSLSPQENNFQEKSIKSQRTHHSGIEHILQDMRKFDECEKALSKKQFKLEYDKQMLKKKKSFRFKNMKS